MSLQAVSSAAQASLGAVVVNRMEFGPPPLGLFLHSRIMRVLGWSMIGVGGLVGFGLFREGSPEAALLPGAVFVIGVVFMVTGSIVLARRASMRYALTVHERGVLVMHKGSEQSILYTQVQDFSLEEKEQLFPLRGIHVGILRTMSFAWPGGSSRIVHFADASADDVFGAVVGQIQSKLADVVQEGLKSGSSLAGKGWMLDSHGLRVEGQEPVRLGELAAVSLYGDKISLWRAEEDLPFLAVPKASPNARLLGVKTVYKPTGLGEVQAALVQFLAQNHLTPSDLDLVVLGTNGDARHDGNYTELTQLVAPATTLAYFKHLCGEYFTASAFGLAMSALAVRHNGLPTGAVLHAGEKESFRKVLLYNQFQGVGHSFYLLSDVEL